MHRRGCPRRRGLLPAARSREHSIRLSIQSSIDGLSYVFVHCGGDDSRSKTERYIACSFGGFVNFHLRFPELCDSSEKVGGANSPVVDPSGVQLTTPSMSAYLGDRSLPPNDGVTKILPNLYLGSQADALDQSLLKEHNITYVVNMSITCPRPEFLTNDEHFLRIPVHDSHAERLLPHFEAAFNFLEQVRERKEIALIHCLAGISRSPSMAIAYVMRHKRMTQDEAYRFVKEKRPSISPNFNFMGQLFEYEKMLQSAHILTPPPSASASPISNTDTSNNSSGSDSETNGAAKKVTRMPKSASVGHVPISAPAIRLQRPTRIDVPTSPGINEFGKRASDTPYPVHERPKQLSFPSLPPVPQTPTQEQPKLQRPTRFNPCCRQRRGIHLALDARKELPSPSTEMERLTFANSNELSVSNPIFPQQQPGVPLHSTQPSGSQTQSNVARASSSFSNFPTISENSVMYATNPVFQSVASRTPCSEDKPQLATLTLLRTPLEPGRVLLQKPTSLSSSSHSSPAFTSPHCSTESPESGFVEGQTSGFESASASAPVLHETSMETATPKPELPQNAADWELLAARFFRRRRADVHFLNPTLI
ncbi:hypothetical protein L596_002211 [Steinernema carpocapsae]|uniref:protein-tyrosine-phosphatase n=2 Tax=Steinernema carpocapsae TaxID=34508 RepID=A0A4U8UNH3_STECR|nr:hypothetical protein L596_002211 [Steinernema carpocapsae]